MILSEVFALFINGEWNTKIEDDSLLKTTDDKNTMEKLGEKNLPLTWSLLDEIKAGFWHTRNWRRRQR